jgi:hypothetical protein
MDCLVGSGEILELPGLFASGKFIPSPPSIGCVMMTSDSGSSVPRL